MELVPLLSSSWLLSSCLFFTGLYILGYWVIFARRIPCGKLERFKAASCCMSIVHGTSTSLAATIYMLKVLSVEKSQASATPFSYTSWLQFHLGAPNTPFENAIMEYSTAYFLVDLLHYMLFVPNQPLFIIHHLFCSSYMLSCRFYTRHGAFSTIVLFAVAECTSFLQNLWSIASLTESTTIFNKLNAPFLTTFTVFRGIVMPWVARQLCLYYLYSPKASSVVPFWLAVYWMGSVFMGIAGSLYWVGVLWAKFMLNPSKGTEKAPSQLHDKRKDL